jgi:Cft2 family RNA processing exonuclease
MKARQTKQPNEQDHRLLALWAADCAEHVLPYFEERYPKDDRPHRAIEAARAWTRGEIRVGQARAAGHAAATAHVAGHARGAAAYAVKAATESVAATESDWQYQRLPEHLRPVAFPSRPIVA